MTTGPACADLIVVLSMHDEDVYAERCIRAGAPGYVMKRESTKRVITAIHEARIKQKLRLATASELLREAVRWHDKQSEGVAFTNFELSKEA